MNYDSEMAGRFKNCDECLRTIEQGDNYYRHQLELENLDLCENCLRKRRVN